VRRKWFDLTVALEPYTVIVVEFAAAWKAGDVTPAAWTIPMTAVVTCTGLRPR